MTDISKLFNVLNIEKGIIAFVGAGGKTSLLNLLSFQASLSSSCSVLTTTHMYKPDNIPYIEDDCRQKLSEQIHAAKIVFKRLCVGCTDVGGKITTPCHSVSEISTYFDYTFVEADGAKRMPLKYPEYYEPVIPCECKTVVGVCGLSSIGKPISEAVFRNELYCKVSGRESNDIVSCDDICAILTDNAGTRKGVHNNMRFIVILNQADNDNRISDGLYISKKLHGFGINEVYISSVLNGGFISACDN